MLLALLLYTSVHLTEISSKLPTYTRVIFFYLNFVNSDRIRAIATAMDLFTIIWTSGDAGGGMNYDTGGMLS